MSFDDDRMIPLDQEEQSIIIHGSDDDDEDDDLSSEEFDDEEGEETIASPLNDMSTLLRQLPVKRGLSKHYDGKSQSFTSLSNVKCLEDLPKVENSYNKKKLKSCRSYGGLLFCSAQNQPSSAAVGTAASKGSNCSGQGYIGSSNGTRPPPIARSRSSSLYTCGGALLFA